jgi:hypothetical protein
LLINMLRKTETDKQTETDRQKNRQTDRQREGYKL